MLYSAIQSCSTWDRSWSRDHNCWEITKLCIHCLVYLLTSLMWLDVKLSASNATNNKCWIKIFKLISALGVLKCLRLTYSTTYCNCVIQNGTAFGLELVSPCFGLCLDWVSTPQNFVSVLCLSQYFCTGLGLSGLDYNTAPWSSWLFQTFLYCFYLFRMLDFFLNKKVNECQI